MILYTPLSPDDVFPTEESHANDQRHVISYEGKMVYVQQKANDHFEILQLMSTNPDDYLHDQFQPGTELSFQQIVTK
ncbi:MAG TPA: YlzJ-like family protein [Bacillota bacterium]|nr:YlzJ-like family protein [Bacillota bacterium]